MTIVSPAGYIHSQAFNEIAETLYYGLSALGYDSILTTRLDEPGHRSILFGAHLLNNPKGPQPKPGSILYNLEQVGPGSEWMNSPYLELLRRHPVWDYSQRNIAALRVHGVHDLTHVPIGWMPQLTRIPLATPDIDVLFYGSLNERRLRILNELKALGVRVQHVFGIYGRERDALIARAKIVLNIHYYEAKIFEIARVSYLLANGVCVVSETGMDPEEHQFTDALAFAPYEGLVSTCLRLLSSPEERKRIAAQGKAVMQSRREDEFLWPVLAVGKKSDAGEEKQTMTPFETPSTHNPNNAGLIWPEAMRTVEKKQGPTILGLSMVKNEQDVIEAFVRHNLRLLDRLVVLDNGSVDATRDILGKLEREFDNLTVVDDEAFGYTQSEKMTALFRRYQKIHLADYVFGLDADEFLDAPDREYLLAELANIPQNGLGIYPWATFVLTPEIVNSGADDPLRMMGWRRSEEGGPLPFWKSVLRLDGNPASDIVIEQGNHLAHTDSGRQMRVVGLTGLRLMHFPIRCRDQFVAKSVVGWMAYLAKNPNAAADSQGIHWQTNYNQLIHTQSIDTQALCDLSLNYAQLPRSVDWSKDVVQETPQLYYERRYSTGKFLGALELIARTWEHSFSVNGSQKKKNANPTEELFAKLLEKGKLQEAVNLLEASLAVEETAELWNDWATLQCNFGNAGNGERGYRRALEINATDRQAAVNLGLMLLAQGRLQEGVPLLEQHKSTLTQQEKEAVLKLVNRVNEPVPAPQPNVLAPAENTICQEASLAEAATSTPTVCEQQVCAGPAELDDCDNTATPIIDTKIITPGRPGDPRTSHGFVICDDHFRYLPDPKQAAALFKKSVQFVEIEIHSYCNRDCDFCGNSFIDRRSNKTLMDPALYSKIIDDLASIGYSGVIWYSRYNEPTSDRGLFLERLREAKAKLPHARLQTFTNGDYLTAEYIEALRDAGLSALLVMTYLARGQEPSFANFIETTVRRLKKLGLPWKFTGLQTAEVTVPGIHVTYNFDNFLKTGTNRGGALATGNIIERRSPCTVPINRIYIDHNGAMVPCCDIRSDYEPHKDCVVYTLTPENSIFEGFANSPLVLWRRDLNRFGEKQYPCNSCSRGLYPETKEFQRLFGNMAQAIDLIPAESIGQVPDEPAALECSL